MARRFEPLLVNTVVGFIGPEYLYDGKQIIRAGLEDHFCGKLLGLPMGCDVCYTNHAEADQDDMDNPAHAAGRRRLQLFHGRAGRRRHHAQLSIDVVSRQPLLAASSWGCARRPEFEQWLEEMQIVTGEASRCCRSTAAPLDRCGVATSAGRERQVGI